MWQLAEEVQLPGSSRYHQSHKSRNNNNNNSQEEALCARTGRTLAVCDSVHACRTAHCSYGHTRPLSALPGLDYTRPLLHQNPECAEIPGPAHYYIRAGPGLDHHPAAGAGSARDHGGAHGPLTSLLTSSRDQTIAGSAHSAKEFSIRVISV